MAIRADLAVDGAGDAVDGELPDRRGGDPEDVRRTKSSAWWCRKVSIRNMIPMGTVQRKCIVCGYPINAKSDELTAHEIKCLKIPEQEK